MSTVTVHNISERPNTPGDQVSIMIGGQKLRPGQAITIDDSVLNARHRAMHGTRIWIGDLPPRLTRTSRSALAAQQAEARSAGPRPLSIEEARAYLADLPSEDLLEMAAKASPPVEFSRAPSHPALVSRLSRALFQPGRELDPESFAWLGRWKRVRGGYVPVEE